MLIWNLDYILKNQYKFNLRIQYINLHLIYLSEI